MSMTAQANARAGKGEKTMLTALLLSAPGPIVTILAVLSSQSATQLADCVRRIAELAAMFVSWWVYRKIHRDAGMNAPEQARLERLANLCVGGAMALSGAVMLALALLQGAAEPGGNVTMGLAIAVLGLLMNGFFWLRYRKLARAENDAVLAAQQTLYRAKTSVDLCVTLALAAVAIAPLHPATPWVDLLGSVAVAGYLLVNGGKTVRRAVREGGSTASVA